MWLCQNATRHHTLAKCDEILDLPKCGNRYICLNVTLEHILPKCDQMQLCQNATSTLAKCDESLYLPKCDTRTYLPKCDQMQLCQNATRHHFLAKCDKSLYLPKCDTITYFAKMFKMQVEGSRNEWDGFERSQFNLFLFFLTEKYPFFHLFLYPRIKYFISKIGTNCEI